MSEQPLDLSRVLALCAFGYNQRARQCLLAIVPEALGEQLGSAWRLGDELLDSATGPCEERLAAPWLALRAQPDLVEEESETTESGAPSPDQMPTGDVDVDAFFAAGEATHETDAALESTGLPPGEGAQQVDSQLPATLVARLMIGATDQKAADLLSDLPLALQGEVLTKIARSTALSVRRDLEEEERGALQALRDILSDDTESWGVSRTCQILRSLDGTPPLRRALGSAADVDAEVVAVVQSHLFEFDDLARLRDTELQALLGTCDNANLARALFDTTEAMRDRVMANVSDRRAGLLTDETDLHAESTPDEIDLARREILARARVLYEQGAITTYFGSVAIESDLQVAEEEEEAEERQEKPERKRPSSPERPEPESGRKLRRLVLAFVAMGLSALLLVQVASWLTSPSRSPVETTRPSRSSSGESGRRIAVASPSGSTSGSARSRRMNIAVSLTCLTGVRLRGSRPSPQRERRDLSSAIG